MIFQFVFTQQSVALGFVIIRNQRMRAASMRATCVAVREPHVGKVARYSEFTASKSGRHDAARVGEPSDVAGWVQLLSHRACALPAYDSWVRVCARVSHSL